MDQAVTAAAWYPPVGARACPLFHQKRDATSFVVTHRARQHVLGNNGGMFAFDGLEAAAGAPSRPRATRTSWCWAPMSP